MKRRAFTLIELLVVIAIIAVLISVLMPALQGARESGSMAKCLAVLKEHGSWTEMYMEDESKPIVPFHMGFDIQYNQTSMSVQLISEHIYGGYHTLETSPLWQQYQPTDFGTYPTDIRPMNKYVAPGPQAPGVVLKQYVCPSDKSHVSPLVGNGVPSGGVPAVQPQSAWQINGNSFAINWYWAEGPPWDQASGDTYGGGSGPNDSTSNMHGAGGAMLSKKVGGAAARFALYYENLMNGFMYDARPPPGISVGLYGRDTGQSQLTGQLMGWHKKLSRYDISFLDGHGEYRYVDTRYTHHDGMTTWPEPNTPVGY